MNNMRKMGNLLQNFQVVSGVETMCGEDLIKRENFMHLEKPLNKYCKGVEDESEKAGSKLTVGYFLEKAAEAIQVYYMIEEVNWFLSVLKLS